MKKYYWIVLAFLFSILYLIHILIFAYAAESVVEQTILAGANPGFGSRRVVGGIFIGTFFWLLISVAGFSQLSKRSWKSAYTFMVFIFLVDVAILIDFLLRGQTRSTSYYYNGGLSIFYFIVIMCWNALTLGYIFRVREHFGIKKYDMNILKYAQKNSKKYKKRIK